jgi:hypothetical protein
MPETLFYIHVQWHFCEVITDLVYIWVDSPPLATLFAECDWKDWVNIDYPNKIEGTNGEYELRFRALGK